jgi:hypothetical protein
VKHIIILLSFLLIGFTSFSQVDSLAKKFIFSKIFNKSLNIPKLKRDTMSQTNHDSFLNLKMLKSDTTEHSSTNLNKNIIIDTNTTYNESSGVNNSQYLSSESKDSLNNSIRLDTLKSGSVNIIINGGNNIQLNFSQNGNINIIDKNSKEENLGESNKKGFLNDMDASKLTSLITLILATIPLIISSIK